MARINSVTEVAAGIYRYGSTRVNWYLVEENESLTVIDTGFPAHWPQLLDHLERFEYELGDIDACVLTHAHPDHIGFAERLRTEADVTVWLHHAGIQRARNGGEPPLGGFIKNLWRPAVFRYFVEVLRSNGTAIPPLSTVDPLTDGQELDVPGQPRVLYVPGHTQGEVALYLPAREVLFCGDALATVDFQSWAGHFPQLLPDWLQFDPELARESLSRFRPIGPVTVLPGHGDPWTGDLTKVILPE